jgi:hypothetical protein
VATGSARLLQPEVYAVDERAGLVDEAEVVLAAAGVPRSISSSTGQLARSQFVFSQARGRPAVWWQTQKAVQAANPGARVPRGRAPSPLTIAVDTREKYGWHFAGCAVTV